MRLSLKTSQGGIMLFLWLLLSPTAMAWQKDKAYSIIILHTNDHHGHFWHNKNGEYGLAAQKTLVAEIRHEVAKKGGIFLLLSAGDINTGVPESDLQDAEPDIKGMNMIGYDAMAIGNHEFDKPLAILRKQQQWATFPFLSANIYQPSIGQRLFKPYLIFNKQGIKIAVIGLTTDDTVKLGNPGIFSDIEFRSPVNEAKTVIQSLRANEKPDIVIAATHMGHYNNGEHGSNAPGDVEMARSLPTGYLDMIVGGHSQDPVCMSVSRINYKQVDYVPGTLCIPDRQNGTWILQAHEWGKYVGRADFEFKNGKFILTRYRLIPINLKQKRLNEDGSTELTLYTREIPPDVDMVKLLSPFQTKGRQQLDMKLGFVDGRLQGSRNKIRFDQTNLARLILASQVERVNADFAIMSSGMIRNSIERGEISYRQVLKVLPFANHVAYVDFNGQEVKNYLAAVASKTPGSGAYAQFYNISLIRHKDGAITDIKIAGQPLDIKKHYWMATLDFIAFGGDGYPKISHHPNYVNSGLVDTEVLKHFIEKHAPLKVNDYAPGKEIINH
ncbi:Mannosylglucosyl-3-phosphoglycerate phosphatase [Arsenophonus endosymbiont of Aleurodicus floccissimus]|uniref:bifunctional UDP-sugar hydrolase/5'-nucleotidase UshA n=1 Tax=Arsenophonus endosymbiont of Aleurodicus floccissimus TaxID=2152761 RepID=UPI000E6B2220|nr:bifunctional UDP-sugar hydrolase/5'-nucleotidase UshA [Arsenophonus endosymbiont of Aleurodicus floccissimus]SPP32321.1 Mannosylglucosyl-3-phosphoglycerate phosphatase [Arsenophonus endosymbiont of Aleurodicus floccissimus]